MLVFIDESGDPGVRVDRGASPVFVAVMVIFADGADAAQAQEAIDRSDARRIHKPEFKFSGCSSEVRDLFFACVRSLPFRVRAIVVRKEVPFSPRLRSDKDRFYEYFVKQMLLHDNGALTNARVVIDGSAIGSSGRISIPRFVAVWRRGLSAM